VVRAMIGTREAGAPRLGKCFFRKVVK
jgi:hypothetical protein